MSEEEYGWLLVWSMIQYNKATNDEDQDKPRWLYEAMASINAVGGRLRAPPRASSNDPTAALAWFLIILALRCAKNTAKIVNSQPDICKINDRAFFSQIAWIALQMGAAGLVPSLSSGDKTITSPHTSTESSREAAIAR